MKFYIDFNWYKSNQNKLLLELGCNLEERGYSKNIEDFAELKIFQKHLQQIQEDKFLDLIFDMDCNTIYINNEKS